MSKQRPLSATNPYCKDARLKKRMLYNSAASSSAVEGVDVTRLKSTKKSPTKFRKTPIIKKAS